VTILSGLDLSYAGANDVSCMTRIYGHPNWAGGHAPAVRPDLPTEFETRMRTLGLTLNTCLDSKELRRWCEMNCNRCFIPEWLLKAWGILVDSDVA
jgi:hypothetical protein